MGRIVHTSQLSKVLVIRTRSAHMLQRCANASKSLNTFMKRHVVRHVVRWDQARLDITQPCSQTRERTGIFAIAVSGGFFFADYFHDRQNGAFTLFQLKSYYEISVRRLKGKWKHLTYHFTLDLHPSRWTLEKAVISNVRKGWKASNLIRKILVELLLETFNPPKVNSARSCNFDTMLSENTSS